MRIKASSVNPLDTRIRTGTAPHAQRGFPAVPGLDLSAPSSRSAPQ
ncbi:hypothetical protein ACIRPX_42955 [Streptomyces sp. NPDC101225]